MDDPARLKWQCRRGTKELDFLLNRYLETGYLAADQGEILNNNNQDETRRASF